MSDGGAWRHGTSSGYRNYACRCAGCREAHRVKLTDWRRRKGVKPVGKQPTRHGTMNAYNRHHCRCDLCREANALHTALYRASIKRRAAS